MTPQEAHYNAQQYYLHAQSLPEGEAKNQALWASSWWGHEAYRLSQLPAAPVPPPAPAPAPAPAPVKNHTLAIVLATVIPIVLIVVIGGAALAVNSWSNFVRNATTSASPYDSEIPTGTIPPLPEPPPESSQQSGLSTVENDWRSGVNALEVPADLDVGPPSKFSESFPDATSFVNRESASGIRIVYTDDSSYNCGWEPGYDFAGCYSPDYKETIFLWWNDNTSDADRQFIAAHELSHYFQWKYKFDLMYSAKIDYAIDYEAWTKAVETDATCRVLSWGGYDRGVASRSSSPCDTNNWSETWLEDQASILDIVVEDW